MKNIVEDDEELWETLMLILEGYCRENGVGDEDQERVDKGDKVNEGCKILMEIEVDQLKEGEKRGDEDSIQMKVGSLTDFLFLLNSVEMRLRGRRKLHGENWRLRRKVEDDVEGGNFRENQVEK
ncbi:unnamed protein product [Vicia faba]|uniref:Uncharacterized protein n=1 Tax=Vicia faba TaxID=3906 RepID=A0AAV0ZR83_VICFA|nr:unnamed protein product [Vicia faba]